MVRVTFRMESMLDVFMQLQLSPCRVNQVEETMNNSSTCVLFP